jgi:hypothetical protein
MTAEQMPLYKKTQGDIGFALNPCRIEPGKDRLRRMSK